MDMVERVARGICAGNDLDPDKLDMSGHTMADFSRPVPQWRLFEGDARAALEAMREPTEAMVKGSHDKHGYDGDYSAIRYRAMIDAAIAEGLNEI